MSICIYIYIYTYIYIYIERERESYIYNTRVYDNSQTRIPARDLHDDALASPPHNAQRRKTPSQNYYKSSHGHSDFIPETEVLSNTRCFVRRSPCPACLNVYPPSRVRINDEG